MYVQYDDLCAVMRFYTWVLGVIICIYLRFVFVAQVFQHEYFDDMKDIRKPYFLGNRTRQCVLSLESYRLYFKKKWNTLQIRLSRNNVAKIKPYIIGTILHRYNLKQPYPRLCSEETTNFQRCTLRRPILFNISEIIKDN